MRRLPGILALFAASVATAATYDYRVLATTRTSTMEKEMNAAAGDGYAFAAVMGGQTAFGGKEVVVVMQKDASASAGQKRAYRLLATSRTSAMEKDIQQLGEAGYEYRGQTVFDSEIGGPKVVVILEQGASPAAKKIEYRLLATSKTSTMEKELRAAGDAGFHLLGMTTAKTAFGGSELVCILRKD